MWNHVPGAKSWSPVNAPLLPKPCYVNPVHIKMFLTGFPQGARIFCPFLGAYCVEVPRCGWKKHLTTFRTLASAQWDVEGSFAVSYNAYIWALSPSSTACCHLFMLVSCPCSRIQPPLAPRLVPSLAGVVFFPNAFSSGRLQSTAAFCVLPDIIIFIISQKDLSSVLCSGFPCFFTALG